ncbi:MAG: methionine--tRNA ligase [Alphaproteobacteria bacterium]|nr:methionine--tRNA ligase [Alphaproteobacteria bacterium]
MTKSYYITTPIYYVNAPPHLGSAYTTLACDVIARFKRLDGFDVTFLTGTDEHGKKVADSAKEEGLTPEAFTDKYSQIFRDLTKALNISNDDFIRTTEERHHKACEAMWNKLEENNQIYLGVYKGWYAKSDEAYYTDDEVEVRADNKVICKASGKECVWEEEPCYFFPLSKWKDRLLQFFDEKPDFIFPRSRREEVINMAKALDEKKPTGEPKYDIPISRSKFKWGIPVPGHPDHVMYVWIDALANYITGVGYPDVESESFKNKWPADVHMIGKDILKFHTIYWPAFLMAANLEPPKRVFAHGWWTNEGQKMSKSLGNTISPYDLIQTYGLDQTRFFLMRAFPFGKDGDFSEKAIFERVNTCLANGLGNLALRSLTMLQKSFDGKMPVPDDLTSNDQKQLEKMHGLVDDVRKSIDKQAIHSALDEIWDGVSATSKYFTNQSPWKLAETDPKRMGTILYVTAESLRHIAVLAQPFMPDSMNKMLDQLGAPSDKRTIASLTWEGALKPDTALPLPTVIFPRYEMKELVPQEPKKRARVGNSRMPGF